MDDGVGRDADAEAARQQGKRLRQAGASGGLDEFRHRAASA